MTDAISTIFGNLEYGGDAATMDRVNSREAGFLLFSDNVILGSGFKSWIQEFFCMFYFLIYFIFPIYRSILGLFGNNELTIFFSLLYLSSVPRLFLNGQPLDWQHMV
ncbi:MAG: hypothetical protein ACJASR_002238 [Psychroserpens sp.]|jgi:hypothetical protein